MTATKAKLVEFIIDNFENPEHSPASKSKLESFKKAELEEFIHEKSSEEAFDAWAANN